MQERPKDWLCCGKDEHGRSLAVDADDVAHADLEVGVPEVVLADVHVADRCCLQGLGEALPGADGDLEVLAHVQRPDVPAGQHPGKVLQLRVQHPLQSIIAIS